ncbi:tRNA uridine-5-carboxymethylaminomethyl(34) synthesis GTPase MnmE [Amylibacter kogurei]|uniref:tRNA modification GTPase MnmE n=1 Tax=Paramylibacter kogurei TaxID=1889778 RepID=A0A2G5KBM0_9RHOB|nr:tRNA uridine-5-carboxymethylaminomethyl(34) synthesis GTPase MnmE [Amylibacter kogurei]PIB26569.1 tRNA uridine-5-carboxymethylaminomethyl(34) synthesis GTPase MnmE [Amylibacter kogurei]
MSDVIFALASAKGRAGVAVLRLSGRGAVALIEEYVGTGLTTPDRSLRKFKSGGELIDEVLILTFAKGASFTGEEVVEIHCHGSTAVVSALLRILGDHPNARMAEPGEFTRKALENGCLDLVQVEGLADLIDAETEAQRKLASNVMTGALSDKVNGWRRDLIRAVSLIEATIDFADEDIPTDVSPEVLTLIDNVTRDLESEIKGSFAAERIRDGFEVAIVGKPNVGKSTLLNALAGREAAITSEIAGTTRDVIEVRMDINGLAVTLLDTAGIRETDNQIEKLGVGLARQRAEAADLRVFLTENGEIEGLKMTPLVDDIVAIGKSDISASSEGLKISGKSGQGIDKLIEIIDSSLSNKAAFAQTATRERHRIGMEQALHSLNTGRALVLDGPEVSEIAAAELHQGIASLNGVIGKVDVEDLLDEIFASFCLGK